MPALQPADEILPLVRFLLAQKVGHRRHGAFSLIFRGQLGL